MLSVGHLIDQRCNSWNCSSGRRLGRRLDWSAWVDLNHRSPASKAGGDGQAPLHAGATRWLPDQDSNLDLPGNNRGSYRWTIGEELVEHLGLEPSSISLQGRSADPARAPIGFALGGQTLRLRVHGAMARRGSDPANRLVPGVGFEPTSPRLQRGAFTRLASQANCELVRPTGIEPVSARWLRTALPLSYGC